MKSGGYYSFDRERRRTYPISRESPESKGRKPDGRSFDALCMGQRSWDARVQGKPREKKEKRKERELVGVARDIFGR